MFLPHYTVDLGMKWKYAELAGWLTWKSLSYSVQWQWTCWGECGVKNAAFVLMNLIFPLWKISFFSKLVLILSLCLLSCYWIQSYLFIQIELTLMDVIFCPGSQKLYILSHNTCMSGTLIFGVWDKIHQIAVMQQVSSEPAQLFKAYSRKWQSDCPHTRLPWAALLWRHPWSPVVCIPGPAALGAWDGEM